MHAQRHHASIAVEYSESERPSGSSLVRRPPQRAVVRKKAVLVKSLYNKEFIIHVRRCGLLKKPCVPSTPLILTTLHDLSHCLFYIKIKFKISKIAIKASQDNENLLDKFKNKSSASGKLISQQSYIFVFKVSSLMLKTRLFSKTKSKNQVLYFSLR